MMKAIRSVSGSFGLRVLRDDLLHQASYSVGDQPQDLEQGVGLKDEKEFLLQSSKGFQQPPKGREGSPKGGIGGHIQHLREAAERIYEVPQLMEQTFRLLRTPPRNLLMPRN